MSVILAGVVAASLECVITGYVVDVSAIILKAIHRNTCPRAAGDCPTQDLTFRRESDIVCDGELLNILKKHTFARILKMTS